MTIIRVVDYAPAPGGRFISDGPFSGEWFREEVVKPALVDAIKSDKMLTVELDGAAGYGSSFLEEAFGGLIRTRAFARADIERYLTVVARTKLYQPYQGLAGRYMREARPASVAA